jgi:hypothetical protein
MLLQFLSGDSIIVGEIEKCVYYISKNLCMTGTPMRRKYFKGGMQLG